LERELKTVITVDEILDGLREMLFFRAHEDQFEPRVFVARDQLDSFIRLLQLVVFDEQLH